MEDSSSTDMVKNKNNIYETCLLSSMNNNWKANPHGSLKKKMWKRKPPIHLTSITSLRCVLHSVEHHTITLLLLILYGMAVVFYF